MGAHARRGQAEYPVNQTSGAGGEMVMCDLWDRCWCVLELAIRYLAEKKVACKHKLTLLLHARALALLLSVKRQGR